MASVASAAIGALLEFNEISVRKLNGDKVEYQILTSGFSPDIVKFKTLVWSKFFRGLKELEVTDMKVIKRALATDRYIITICGVMKEPPQVRVKNSIQRWERGRLIPRLLREGE